MLRRGRYRAGIEKRVIVLETFKALCRWKKGGADYHGRRSIVALPDIQRQIRLPQASQCNQNLTYREPRQNFHSLS